MRTLPVLSGRHPQPFFKGFTETSRLRKTRQASDLFHRIILTQSVAIHHRAAKDRPTSCLGQLTREQGQKRIVNQVRHLVSKYHLVTLVMYGKEFIQAPLPPIMIALPIITINGICEEFAARTVTQFRR